MSEMIYTKRALKDIKPYERNPRNNENAVDDVAESIKQCGYISPVIVDEDGVILAGHARFKALSKLKYKECEVIIAKGLSEEQKRKYRLYDNKTAEFSKWDEKELKQELAEVDFDNYDFGQPAFEPVQSEDSDPKPNVVVCPCCGEVFEA